jgi:hypothetical protein
MVFSAGALYVKTKSNASKIPIVEKVDILFVCLTLELPLFGFAMTSLLNRDSADLCPK